MAHIRFAPRRSAGFTLVEIAIVLVIASLLIAAGIGISVAVVDNVRAKTTRQNMDAVKTALQSFIARYGRLPCPAVETLAPGAAGYGIEDTRTTDPATSCTNTVNLPGQVGPPAIDAGKRGVVPWKTLGMTLEGASDGWNNQLTYIVTVTATTKTIDTVSGMRGWIYLHSATPPTAGLPPTGNQINACSTTADDNACNKAAVVVIISHGRNGAGAYTSAGVRSPLSADAAELENTDDDRMVVSAEASPTYDDLVAPLTPDDFLATLAAQGALKSERAMLFDRARQVVIQMMGEVTPLRAVSCSGTLACNTPANCAGNLCIGAGSCSLDGCQYALPAPAGLANYTFEANRFNTSCDPPYNTTAAVTAVVSDVTGSAAQIKDPWGQTFKFGRAISAITSASGCPVPIAIISVGPDATAGTLDDYVYYSPMAEWKEILGKVGW